MLKIDSRSRSDVGRIAFDDGAFRFRPRNFPLTMRMRGKFSFFTFAAPGRARHSFCFSIFREREAKRARSVKGQALYAAPFAGARLPARAAAPKNPRLRAARLFHPIVRAIP